MKIFNTENHYFELLKNKNHAMPSTIKKKGKANDFKKILEKTMSDQNEDWEEFSVLLPKEGHFWDNGYEDLDKEVL